MSVINNIDALFQKSSCRIVFVNDRDTGIELADRIRSKEPRYLSEIGKKCAAFKRVGPFKVKNGKRLFDLVYKTKYIQDLRSEYSHGTVVHAAFRELFNMDFGAGDKLEAFGRRRISSLSYPERLRVSIIHKVLTDNYYFLISDCFAEEPVKPEEHRETLFTIARYMKEHDQFEWAPCELIWISLASPAEILGMMNEKDHDCDFFTFYTVEDGCIVQKDQASLLDGHSLSVKAPAKPTVKPEPKPAPKPVAQPNPAPKPVAQPKSAPEKAVPQSKVPVKTAADAPQRKANRDLTAEERARKSVVAVDVQHAEKLYQEKQYVLALPLFESGAKWGHGFSQLVCGFMYQNGQGCTVDYSKALHWYEKAAEQGIKEAQYNCGGMYEKGHGCTADLKKALYWKEKAAEQGMAVAQFDCAVMYALAKGCSTDWDKAEYWCEKAAAQGDENAIELLKKLRAV